MARGLRCPSRRGSPLPTEHRPEARARSDPTPAPQATLDRTAGVSQQSARPAPRAAPLSPSLDRNKSARETRPSARHRTRTALVQNLVYRPRPAPASDTPPALPAGHGQRNGETEHRLADESPFSPTPARSRRRARAPPPPAPRPRRAPARWPRRERVPLRRTYAAAAHPSVRVAGARPARPTAAPTQLHQMTLQIPLVPIFSTESRRPPARCRAPRPLAGLGRHV